MTPSSKERAKDIIADIGWGNPNADIEVIAQAIDQAIKDEREACAKVAESDDYKMFLTHNDVAMGALEDEYTPKIRKQARKEVADRIRNRVEKES